MAESAININRKQEGDICVLELIGVLDAKTTPRMNTELKTIIAAGTVKIVCDLSNLKYISSAGIGSFFANQKDARAGGGEIRLAAPTAEVRDVFDLLNFSAAFTMTDDMPAALQEF